jgi:uncharacterized membrane protein
MGRDDPAWAVTLTTIASHVAVFPALAMLLRRRWVFEFSVGSFCCLVSLLYHMSEVAGNIFFLTELQWHRLDNIGAIAVFGGLFVYLCDIPADAGHGHQPALAHQLLQFATLFASVIVQEHDPWNETYTFVPIVAFATMPVLSHMAQGRFPRFVWANVAKGFGLVALGAMFFVFGLDDANDPCRVYHGLWHLLAGGGMWWLWQIVPHETAHPLRRGRRPEHLRGDRGGSAALFGGMPSPDPTI